MEPGWSTRTVAQPPAEDGWLPQREAADPGPLVVREVPDLAPLIRESLARRLPPAVRGGQLRLTWRVVAALALLVALAVAGGAAVVLRGRPHLVAADQPLPGEPTGSPAAVAAAAPTGGPVVEVVGRVHRPGVVQLRAGARVVDAVAAAGGVLPGTDTSGLGLARKVVDGEQVRVGLPGVAPAAPVAAAGGASGPLDLNAASEAQLDGLPGVGPVLAARIVAWRTSHGGFTSTSQLSQVQGLSGKKGEALRELVTVG